ncbi:S-adenosylmethionine decarboxylase [Nocardiopsis sp. CC223A]|uniref:S-adenosylmethionine decarboxylase n=1 Tax=Nocardiopsis sp. CC223A TaxID=3044051 RepID=UPI00278BBD0E|nr:S-adenosylmethionine decarboxylase [Nocardiopsis sp. CC223A]
MICLAVDLTGCTSPGPDPATVGEAMHATARLLGVRVLLEAPVQYPDHGLTFMMALAESHLVVSTWPEHRMVQIDLVSCRADAPAATALEPLLDLFSPAHVAIHRVDRTNPRILPLAV